MQKNGDWLRFVLAAVLGGLVACSSGTFGGPQAAHLRTPEGLSEWQQEEKILRASVHSAYDRYGRGISLDALQGYEKAVRTYLDHGFALYRAYRSAHFEPPPDLIPSLEQRTAWLMDAAEEYIKQGSPVVAESIAADVVHDYSDLPVLTPAQRRAEAVLMRYRYRQDY